MLCVVGGTLVDDVAAPTVRPRRHANGRGDDGSERIGQEARCRIRAQRKHPTCEFLVFDFCALTVRVRLHL